MTTRLYPLLIVFFVSFNLLLRSCTSMPASVSRIATQTPVADFETLTPSQTPSPTLERNTETPPPATMTPTVEKIATSNPTVPIDQLTFFSNRSGLNGIYANEISCLNSHEVCLGDPHLLFDWTEAIPEGIIDWSPGGIDWSPDGYRVISSRGFRGILVLSDWNGENAIQLTDGCDIATWPQWSPDGRQIAFIYNKGKPGCEFIESSQIQLYDLEAGRAKTISTISYPSRVNWLPGGELAYIARVSETDQSEIIRIADPDGKVLREIPENPNVFIRILGLDFSPDGSQLAFVGYLRSESGSRASDIYIFDMSKNSILNLTNASGTNFDPVWSPSGDWIAFMSDRTGDWDIYLIRPDGSGLINVTQNPAQDTDPAWRRIKDHQ